MEDKKRLEPVTADSQRRVNIHLNRIEDIMGQLVQQIVNMWNTQTGLNFDERRQLTLRICRMLIATLGGGVR